MDYYEDMQPVSYQELAEPDFHWNWGAFMFNWIFGFANKAWLCFLCFVPLLSIVWVFFCGAKGEKWAWESDEFENETAFRATMRSWNRAGLLTFIVAVVVFVVYVILGLTAFTAFRQNGVDFSGF